jgi:hypothetical protein
MLKAGHIDVFVSEDVDKPSDFQQKQTEEPFGTSFFFNKAAAAVCRIILHRLYN